jgi:hypothetical protein
MKLVYMGGARKGTATNMTVGKVYVITNTAIGSDYGKYWEVIDTPCVYLIDDNGRNDIFYERYFMPIDEYRNIQLNKIL